MRESKKEDDDGKERNKKEKSGRDRWERVGHGGGGHGCGKWNES